MGDQSSVWLVNPSGQRAGGGFIDDTLRQRAQEQGLLARYRQAGEFPRQRVEVIRGPDPFRAANETYYQRGWTDGLPIVPPTLERVGGILRGSPRPRNESLGALDPLKGEATVEKIAANAVMAGCTERHFPVVLAAVEAIGAPEFNLRGVQTTDENVAPLLIFSGPDPEAYELNSGFGALGPGWRGNAAIGRALRLVMNNIGGGWPGAVSLAGLAQPGRYSLCFAESPRDNPWPSLRQDLGFEDEDSVLVVMRAESVVNVTGGIEELASVMASATSAFSLAHGGQVAVALSPFTARELAGAGKSKTDVREQLHRMGRIPAASFDRFWIRRTIATSQMPSWITGAAAGAALPVVESETDICLVVAGGDLAIAQHAYFPGWGFPACRIARKIS